MSLDSPRSRVLEEKRARLSGLQNQRKRKLREFLAVSDYYVTEPAVDIPILDFSSNSPPSLREQQFLDNNEIGGEELSPENGLDLSSPFPEALIGLLGDSVEILHFPIYSEQPQPDSFDEYQPSEVRDGIEVETQVRETRKAGIIGFQPGRSSRQPSSEVHTGPGDVSNPRKRKRASRSPSSDRDTGSSTEQHSVSGPPAQPATEGSGHQGSSSPPTSAYATPIPRSPVKERPYVQQASGHEARSGGDVSEVKQWEGHVVSQLATHQPGQNSDENNALPREPQVPSIQPARATPEPNARLLPLSSSQSVQPLTTSISGKDVGSQGVSVRSSASAERTRAETASPEVLADVEQNAPPPVLSRVEGQPGRTHPLSKNAHRKPSPINPLASGLPSDPRSLKSAKPLQTSRLRAPPGPPSFFGNDSKLSKLIQTNSPAVNHRRVISPATRRELQRRPKPKGDYRTAMAEMEFTFHEPIVQSLYQKVQNNQKVSETSDWSASHEEAREREVFRRIRALQESGKWSFLQPTRATEPDRHLGHWDYLLGEMRWMRTDFREEKKWKMMAARRMAEACVTWHQSGAKLMRKDDPLSQRPGGLEARQPRDNVVSQPELILATNSDQMSAFTQDVVMQDSPHQIPFIRQSRKQITQASTVRLQDLQPQDIYLEVDNTPTIVGFLESLPMYDPTRDVSKGSELHDAKVSQVVIPSHGPSKYGDMKIAIDTKSPQLAISRFDYEEETRETEHEGTGETPTKISRYIVPPKMPDQGLFSEAFRTMRDRITSAHAFRPPSDPLMPPQSFYDRRQASQWTRAEDDQLKAIVQQYPFNWALCSMLISDGVTFRPGKERRTAWECFERWVMLQGMPPDMSKTIYFKSYCSRINKGKEMAIRTYDALHPGVAESVREKMPHSIPYSEERGPSMRGARMIEAMKKLNKKREAQEQKNQQQLASAQSRRLKQAQVQAAAQAQAQAQTNAQPGQDSGESKPKSLVGMGPRAWVKWRKDMEDQALRRHMEYQRLAIKQKQVAEDRMRQQRMLQHQQQQGGQHPAGHQQAIQNMGTSQAPAQIGLPNGANRIGLPPGASPKMASSMLQGGPQGYPPHVQGVPRGQPRPSDPDSRSAAVANYGQRLGNGAPRAVVGRSGVSGGINASQLPASMMGHGNAGQAGSGIPRVTPEQLRLIQQQQRVIAAQQNQANRAANGQRSSSHVKDSASPPTAATAPMNMGKQMNSSLLNPNGAGAANSLSGPSAAFQNTAADLSGPSSLQSGFNYGRPGTSATSASMNGEGSYNYPMTKPDARRTSSSSRPPSAQMAQLNGSFSASSGQSDPHSVTDQSRPASHSRHGSQSGPPRASISMQQSVHLAELLQLMQQQHPNASPEEINVLTRQHIATAGATRPQSFLKPNGSDASYPRPTSNGGRPSTASSQGFGGARMSNGSARSNLDGAADDDSAYPDQTQGEAMDLQMTADAFQQELGGPVSRYPSAVSDGQGTAAAAPIASN